MFYRKIQKRIETNLKNKDAKILVIDGARQVGKSFIVRHVAKSLFKNYIEINLKDDCDGNRFFESINNVTDFYLQVSALYGDKIGSVDDTVIFLDEIQSYPRILSLLKALKQDNRFRYICSGSLLGVTLKHTFIPMGSIEEAKMYPLDFEEFLYANGVKSDLIDYLKDCFTNQIPVTEGVHKTMLRYFRDYLVSGGLPDAIKEYVTNKNVAATRELQSTTLTYYKDDASKYDEEHSLKIRRIYDSLTSYMENKVKRIKFNKIDTENKNRRKHYEDEFDYLISSGCALDVKAASDPRFPLEESSTKNLIKLYYNDVGILSNILYKNAINNILSLDSNANLGALYETAVAMELKAHGHSLYYFDSKKIGEVDFLINDYESQNILPIEIKSGKNHNNYRAIPKLLDQNGNYKLPKGYLFGNANTMVYENGLVSLPIYLIMFL